MFVSRLERMTPVAFKEAALLSQWHSSTQYKHCQNILPAYVSTLQTKKKKLFQSLHPLGQLFIAAALRSGAARPVGLPARGSGARGLAWDQGPNPSFSSAGLRFAECLHFAIFRRIFVYSIFILIHIYLLIFYIFLHVCISYIFFISHFRCFHIYIFLYRR